MKVLVNGKEKELPSKATLKSALTGEHYVKGTLVSIHLSTEKLVKESDDFEIVTERGSMVIHLDDTPDAKIWRSKVSDMSELFLRWRTERLDAFGSFSTDIEFDQTEGIYKRFDCFFSLGGNDNSTTYMMIARKDHKRSYGAGSGRIGHITKGRHILDIFQEGDRIIEVKPLISEESTENVIVTTDLSFKLEDGYSVDTHVRIKLDESSPESAEHVLILSDKGHMHISDTSGSYAACSEDQDISMEIEDRRVRDIGSVTVRNQGVGLGRIFIYKEKRQLSEVHNYAGTVISGMPIVKMAKGDSSISVVTEPLRLLTVGMTQKKASEFLDSRGVKQERVGDVDDDAIVVEQIPERTIDALKAGKVKTFAVKKDRIYRISLDRKKSPLSVHYFEKVTGLSHKPIGSLKVFFMFDGMPMVQFEGDPSRAHMLYPDEPFKKCKRGDIGVTNQARPNAGLIGIRLEDSKEYGPTGEEGYGTNILGKFEDDLDEFLKKTDDEEVIYVTEERL